jgi:hypothetical protein
MSETISISRDASNVLPIRFGCQSLLPREGSRCYINLQMTVVILWSNISLIFAALKLIFQGFLLL